MKKTSTPRGNFIYRLKIIMKYSAFIALLICSVVSIALARESVAQQLLETPVTIRLENATLGEALDKIARQTRVQFVFVGSRLQQKRATNIKVESESLEKVLGKLLAPYGLSYQVVENRIVIRNAKADPLSLQTVLPTELGSYQQRGASYPVLSALKGMQTVQPINFAQLRISGSVKDPKGEPLPGVTIVIKGTQQGTTTDVNGNYSLVVPDEKAVLIFSYVGYLSEEVLVGNRNSLDIAMKEDQRALNEVVVVGYGMQKRANVTAAISSVPLSELKDMPVANIASALQGKIAGVNVQQISGQPGSSPAIKVRGFGSISAGNSPLIVVDGNIVSMNVFSLLNSSDIESIDVLKDASSTAIYGSKGSNGVILITTKKGNADKTTINLDVYSGFQGVTKKLGVLNSQQFADFWKDAANNAYLDNVPGANILDPNKVRPANAYKYPRGDLFEWFDFDDKQKLANIPTYDYQDMIFRTGQISNAQLSIGGGSEKSRYMISGGVLSQDGIIKRSEFNRYTFRANVETDVLPGLKVGMNLNPSYKVQQEVNAEGHWSNNAVINAALSVIPMVPVYAEDGQTYTSQAAYAGPYDSNGISNPVANVNEYNSKYLSTSLLGNVYAEYKFLKHFKYRLSGNIDFEGNRRNAYRTSKMPVGGLLPPTVSTGTAFSDQRLSALFNQTLNYNTTIADLHEIDILLGSEATKLTYQTSTATGSSYANDVVETLNGSASGKTTTATSSIVENASASYFARANYSYKGKYLANVSVRRDGSSIFGPDNRWGTFPAASIGWRVSEESFMKDLAIISEAKIRASYGLSGNNAFNNYYPYAALLAQDNYAFDNTLANGLTPSTLGNYRLGWERNKQMDLGIDIGIFKNRIFLVADYYNRITRDLLLSVNVPSLTGFNAAVKNIGKMENKGWEVGLTTRNLTGKFAWNTQINMSSNRNKVLALGPNGDRILSRSGVGETNVTMIGQPIGSFFGYKQIGIFQNQAELDSYPHNPTSRPGDVKYEDINNDGVINAYDRTVIGNNQPKFIYGINNMLTYKNFDLNISIQGTQGGKILNLSRRFFDNMEGNANQISIVADRWRSESEPGNGVTPRANTRTTGMNNAISSRWVEDGSYVRIQNISLGYQVPRNVLDKLRLRQVRLYMSAQNLHTWSKYLNYNPEVSTYEDPLTSGVDYGTYPLAKTIIFGLNLGI
jgi:TonB-linked SusC/RagA family outer membrane protein